MPQLTAETKRTEITVTLLVEHPADFPQANLNELVVDVLDVDHSLPRSHGIKTRCRARCADLINARAAGKHCDDCAPEFGCFASGENCSKRPRNARAAGKDTPMNFPSYSYDAWKTTEPEPVADCDYCNLPATTTVKAEQVCASCAKELLEDEQPDEHEHEDYLFRRDAEIDRRIDERRGK